MNHVSHDTLFVREKRGVVPSTETKDYVVWVWFDVASFRWDEAFRVENSGIPVSTRVMGHSPGIKISCGLQGVAAYEP